MNRNVKIMPAAPDTPSVDYAMFDIDLTELDLEWMEQPKRMAQACQKLADLEREEKAAEGLLELRMAKLQQEVRSNPTRHGLDSKGLTETAIKSIVLAHADYRRTWQKHMDAVYAVSVQKGVVKSLEQRKTALECLVRLHGQSYFAVPRANEVDTQMAKERLELERRKRERQERLAKK